MRCDSLRSWASSLPRPPLRGQRLPHYWDPDRGTRARRSPSGVPPVVHAAVLQPTGAAVVDAVSARRWLVPVLLGLICLAPVRRLYASFHLQRGRDNWPFHVRHAHRRRSGESAQATLPLGRRERRSAYQGHDSGTRGRPASRALSLGVETGHLMEPSKMGAAPPWPGSIGL
jgi:hypothetical protein